MNVPIFFERQRGDMCRMHSLNAYFGKPLLNEDTFYKFCDKYDSLISGLESRRMDGFAESRNITSFILEILANKYCVYIPMNLSKNSHNYVDVARYHDKLNKREISNYFEFNKTHIWLNKKVDGQYYKVDSISGITSIDPSLNNSNNGYIIVIDDLIQEVYYYIDKVTTLRSQGELSLEKVKPQIIKKKTFQYEILFFNLFHSAKLLKINNTNYIAMMKRLFKYIKLMRSNCYNMELIVSIC